MSSTVAAPEPVSHPVPAAPSYPDDSIGVLMEPPVAVFPPTMTVAQAVEEVRRLARQHFFTYGYVCDAAQIDR